ncbi:MAG: hypothetical protein H7A52_08350 [Akkermansiaceae bacterium]|nr:hypothetical protein [Akkermansiaceae bacterium]
MLLVRLYYVALGSVLAGLLTLAAARAFGLERRIVWIGSSAFCLGLLLSLFLLAVMRLFPFAEEESEFDEMLLLSFPA